MQYTTNFNLKKPEGTDFYNVNDFNDNMDIIDNELGGGSQGIESQTTRQTVTGNANSDNTLKYKWTHIPNLYMIPIAVKQEDATDSYTLTVTGISSVDGELISTGYDRLNFLPYSWINVDETLHARIGLRVSGSSLTVTIERDATEPEGGKSSTALIKGCLIIPVNEA